MRFRGRFISLRYGRFGRKRSEHDDTNHNATKIEVAQEMAQIRTYLYAHITGKTSALLGADQVSGTMRHDHGLLMFINNWLSYRVVWCSLSYLRECFKPCVHRHDIAQWTCVFRETPVLLREVLGKHKAQKSSTAAMNERHMKGRRLVHTHFAHAASTRKRHA